MVINARGVIGSLFPQFTLCANYFCGVLSETYPNRLVLYSGTSGGNTSNSMFDKSTPKGNNQANGAPFPPRDGNPTISDLTGCFTFG